MSAEPLSLAAPPDAPPPPSIDDLEWERDLYFSTVKRLRDLVEVLQQFADDEGPTPPEELQGYLAMLEGVIDAALRAGAER